MEATLAPPAPVQVDFRAQLHHLIDQIQDEAVLRAALLLLLPQATTAAEEPVQQLSPAWEKELDRRIAEYDPSKNIPFKEVMDRLIAETV